MAPTKNFDLIERLSIAFDDDNKWNVVCENIALDIVSGNIKLFRVVEELGEFLTNKDTSIRDNGVRSLSKILANINENALTDQELQLLASFYCDRLNDHHSIIPAVISGFLAIVKMKNLPKCALAKLFVALPQNVRCQSELRETRRNIYLIFQTLLYSRLEDLKSLGSSFIDLVICSIDGESDPRNLMLLFNYLPYLMKEIHLNEYAVGEMFEVIACYFPVDFNSGGKDEKEISRDDLANALELCLSAIPEFAQYCLPLIIEKLDTNLKVAKMDSLRLLTRGSPIFGVEGLKNHINDLWPLIRKEALPGNDQELKEQALKAITAIVKATSEDRIVMVTFIETVIADTRSTLCDVQLSLYWPAEKLLEAVGQANDDACRLVLKTVVALCLAQYSTNIYKNDRVNLIETLNNFMRIYTKSGLKISDISELSWTDLTSLYLNELSSIKNQDVLKAKLIDGLVIQKESLTQSHRQALYEEIFKEIDCGNDSTRHSCQMMFITFAKLYPCEVLHMISERLIIDGVDTTILKNRIEVLANVGKIKNLGSKIVERLIELAVFGASEIKFASLNAIRKLLMLQKSEYNIHHFLYSTCNIMDKIFHLKFEHGHDSKKLYELRQLISNICWLVILKLTADDQKNIIERYFNLLRVDITEHLLLWEGLVTPLLPCNITPQISDLFVTFMDIAFNNINEYARSSSCRLAAVIINKVNDNEIVEKCLNIVKMQMSRIFNADNENFEQMQAAVVFHAWITKALITRGNKESDEYLNYQINLLKNKFIGEFTGKEFCILVDKNEKTLTTDNFCNIKIFYKQRVLQSVIKQNESFINDARQNYLIALIYLIQEVPMELSFMHLKKLVPLLIESLSLNNGQLILSTLKMLKLLLDTKNEIFIEQVQSFISRCLNLSTHHKMHVRIEALNCLSSYCNYSTSLINPYKDDVLEKLSETIDDKKRLVRQTAVNARIRWYLVGAPGGLE